jgi:hypothetical protein
MTRLRDQLKEKPGERREERIYNCELANAVENHFGKDRCPCCRHMMVVPRGRKQAANSRRDRRTMAHLNARWLDEAKGRQRVWIYACRGCNADQGHFDFKGWMHPLKHAGDPRAAFVAELIAFLDKWQGLAPAHC